MQFDFVEIENIDELEYSGKVFDLTVESDHSYNIDGIIVHNSGGICSTRLVTGFGSPQLTVVMDTAEHLEKAGLRSSCKIISDGGIRNFGDIVKSIWAGADAVMCGYLFAGCDECPKIDGQNIYRGMASRTVSRRDDVASEGVCIKVHNKGSAIDVVKECAAAIKAGCSLGNALTLEELRKNVRAIRVSTITNEESDTLKGIT